MAFQNSEFHSDPDDVVEAQITSLKKYSRKVSSKRRNQAKTYVNVKGNVVSERKLRQLSDCRMKCRGKIPQTFQETIFRSYWVHIISVIYIFRP